MQLLRQVTINELFTNEKEKKMRGESQGGKSTEKEQLQGVSAPQLCQLRHFQYFYRLRLAKENEIEIKAVLQSRKEPLL